MTDLPPYAAVVLAGGRAARMGGRPKPQLAVGGRPMLDTVLAAVPDAHPRVVVGPPQPVPPDVVVVREDPPGGGPVRGLQAGLAALDDPEAPDGAAHGADGVALVAVLAADLPFLTADLVRGLRARVAVEGALDGALVVDELGREQYLLGVWRVAALRDRLADAVGPTSMRSVLAGLAVDRVSPHLSDDRSATGPAPWTDCDTPADLERARAAAGTRGTGAGEAGVPPGRDG